MTPEPTGRFWSPRPRSRLQPASEVTLGTFELRAGQLIELELRLDAPDQSGVVFTHGNHPDSLQLGVDAGRLWFGISGEKEYANGDVAAGRWHQVTIALDDERVALSVDGDEVAVTSHWSASPRWKALPDGALVSIADDCSAARASYAFDTVARFADDHRRGCPRRHGRCGWRRTRPSSIGIVCAYGDDALTVGAAAARVAADVGAALASSEAGLPGPVAEHVHRRQPALQRPPARRSRRRTRASPRSYYMAALLACTCATPGSARRTGLPDRRAAPRPDHHVLLGPHRMEPALRPAGAGRPALVAAAGAGSPYDARSGSIPGAAGRSGTGTRPTTTRCSGWSSTTSASPATGRSSTSRPAG